MDLSNNLLFSLTSPKVVASAMSSWIERDIDLFISMALYIAVAMT